MDRTAKADPQAVIRKISAESDGLVLRADRKADDPLTFVISSESVDLAGDIVVQSGLKPINARIPAQVDHSGSMHDLIGSWQNIQTKGDKTYADLHLLPPGVSRTADLVRAIADAGVRLAASIGFRPDWSKAEDITDKAGHWTGFRFLKAKLLEASVVVVPAQPEALQVRSLLGERDRQTLDQLVAARRRGLISPPKPQGQAQPGRPVPALLRTGSSPETTMKLSEQITAAQTELNALRDEQTATVEKLGDAGLDEETQDALQAQATELAAQIIKKAQRIDALKAAEQSLLPREPQSRAKQNDAGTGGAPAVIQRRDDKPDGMNVVRAACVVFEAYIRRVPVDLILEKRYGEREVVDFVTKATQNPAMTTVPGWAQELVRETFNAFMDLLQPESVVPRLPLNRYTFDGYGSIKIPRRAGRTPNLAAAFRAEGAPIRVGAISLTASTLTPKSMGVIATFTNELFERSTPNIETVARDAMVADTAIALDGIFLGNTPGSAIQPAGLQTYATGANTQASSGNTVAQITADIRARAQRMATQGYGRRPAWIMHPARLQGLQLATNAAGTPAFASTVNGVLLTFPVYTSINVPADIVYLIDTAEVGFAGGVPKFLGTEVATLHEEDTDPDPISTPGAPAVVAAPVRSLFQTNTSALRALWEVDWSVMNPDGPVQTITGVAW